MPILPLASLRLSRHRKKILVACLFFLNDIFAFGIHQDVLLAHSLHNGLQLDESYVERLVQADALIRAKEVAVTFLGYRARTEYEIRQKLQKKGFSNDIAAQVIERLRELSYVDDAKFARDFVRNRFRLKGHGPQRLRMDLRKAGVASIHIDAALEECTTEDELTEAAMQLAKKRWKRLASESDKTKKRRKLYGYLLRRGHASDTVREVLDKLSAEDSNSD